jgi:hypothetical protein
MAKKKSNSAARVIADGVADTTLPKTPVTIGGKVYNLCFDLGALAEAETAINAELLRRTPPQHLNLLVALPVQDLASTRVAFAAAVRKFHPKLGFDEAMGMLTLENVYDAQLAIRAAWDASAAPQQDRSPDPPQPGT